MKTIITSILAIIFTSGSVYSQCTSPVHQNAVAIKTVGDQRNTSDKKYWICDGKSLILTGDYNTIWVDRGGTLSLTGDSNYVYARENTKVTISENFNFVWTDVSNKDGTDYFDNGVNTTTQKCSPMIFDYSVAPAGGCVFWMDIEGVTVVKKAKVYPSPANNQITVDFPIDEIDSYAVRIFDMSGKLIQNSENNQNTNQITVDVSRLPVGTYTVQVESNNVLVNEQFVIQR